LPVSHSGIGRGATLPAPSPVSPPGIIAVKRSEAVIRPVVSVIKRRGEPRRPNRVDEFLVVNLRAGMRPAPLTETDIASDDKAVPALEVGFAPSLAALADFDGCSLRNDGEDRAVRARRFPQIGFAKGRDRFGRRAKPRKEGEANGQRCDPR
jgi:hypothetical protein